ncbi:helix-turn-helix domain-containing protein [Cellulomonas hominis]|uniref:helix-turn-helix domain-containing protein n=1 Tax=Cellulomonas hominis TaxID=156981 RepID=UPI001C0FD13C|nr:XRE family transcriptional regulator [Cellulomonas hominis]MBU5423446.1 helix-turn-helix domain-containing protein [Cellulomonas hominis]
MAQYSEIVGARISEARERRGLTQRELADESGIERSALAKVERGLRGVGALELAALARALDTRLEWFLSDEPRALASHRVGLDSEVTLSTIDKELERIARDVEFAASLDVGLLEGTVDPAAAPASGTAAEELAGRARGMCGLDPRAPVQALDEAATHVGLLVFSMPLGRETADAATTLLERGAVALVNSTLAVGRRRLAVAHELGHYLVADDYTVDWRVGDHSGSERTEVLLDRFARSFLAPREGLAQTWADARKDHDLRTAAVLSASRFRIDMSTLARRLHELGLANESECGLVRDVRTTRADIVDYGLVVAYDFEGSALPRKYEKAILALYRSERVSAERALSLLRGTFQPEDLPPVRPVHEAEIWSIVS